MRRLLVPGFIPPLATTARMLWNAMMKNERNAPSTELDSKRPVRL
jgi:hypothetical protein